MTEHHEINHFGGDYEFLSNFYPVTICYEGIVFPSVEHAYVAAKTEHKSIKAHVPTIPSAAAAKKFGRLLTTRPFWEADKLKVMTELIRLKFANLELRRRLIATGHAELIERNYWGDQFWGTDLDYSGDNWLGKILMMVRTECAILEYGIHYSLEEERNARLHHDA